MPAKRKVQREPYLSQFIFGLMDSDEIEEATVQQVSAQKIFFFAVFASIAMALLVYLVKMITT